MLSKPRLPWLVATREERVTGYAYASRHRSRAAYRWSVEVSVYLVPSEQGRGTARRLYEGLFEELTALGYISAYAGITQPNPASTRSGWRDVAWWHRSLRPSPEQPQEPGSWDGTFGRSPTG